MTAWITRLGTILGFAALALTPAVRVVCLTLCASPVTVAHAADAPPIGRAAPAPPAHHVHHHPGAAAPTGAGAGTRCDIAHRGDCGDAVGVLALSAGRTSANDAAIAPPVSRLAAADLRSMAHAATPPIRVRPPGPPPAPTPLRL